MDADWVDPAVLLRRTTYVEGAVPTLEQALEDYRAGRDAPFPRSGGTPWDALWWVYETEDPSPGRVVVNVERDGRQFQMFPNPRIRTVSLGVCWGARAVRALACVPPDYRQEPRLLPFLLGVESTLARTGRDRAVSRADRLLAAVRQLAPDLAWPEVDDLGEDELAEHIRNACLPKGDLQ